MADEITITANLAATKEGVQVESWPTTTYAEDWTDEDFVDRTQTIGTTEELIDIPAEVATLGWAIFYNLDTTNYVQLFTLTGSVYTAFARIPPQAPCGPVYLAMGRTALYAKANSSSCNIRYRILRA